VSDRSRLVFTGNVIVDLVMTVEGLPEPGGDTIASSSQITAGGGFNVMVAAQRDGLNVVFAGQYGSGPFGEIVQAALGSSGIQVVQAGLPDQDSGFCVALVDRSTERTFVTSVGAEGRLTSADLERITVNDDDIVYVSGYSLAHPVNRDSLPRWLDALPPAARVFTDPSPLIDELDPHVLQRVYRRTDVLSTNAREAVMGSGRTDLDRAAEWFLDRIRPGGLVVIRDGADGCRLAGVRPGEVIHISGFNVDAVDTNGAGDAHGGVLAAALAHGLVPEDAARRANAAAALAVTRSGPATAPTTGQIDELLEAGQVKRPAAANR